MQSFLIGLCRHFFAAVVSLVIVGVNTAGVLLMVGVVTVVAQVVFGIDMFVFLLYLRLF